MTEAASECYKNRPFAKNQMFFKVQNMIDHHVIGPLVKLLNVWHFPFSARLWPLHHSASNNTCRRSDECSKKSRLPPLAGSICRSLFFRSVLMSFANGGQLCCLVYTPKLSPKKQENKELWLSENLVFGDENRVFFPSGFGVLPCFIGIIYRLQ